MQKAINKKSERKAAYLFVIPAVALLAAFLVYPALQTIRYAFTDYNIMRPDRIKFSGINNFVELFQDKNFWIQEERGVRFPGGIFQPAGDFHGSRSDPLDGVI